MRAAGTIRRFDRRLLLTIPAVGCAVLLAACGSSNKSSNAAQAKSAAGLRFADCMRSHGVPNFPDPPSGGGGIQIGGSGVNPSSPAFQSAQNACGKLLPGPKGGGPRASEARKLAMLHLSQCMRRHGISSFPDPTSSPPSSPPSGGGIAFGAPGSFLSIPQTLAQSPGFQQAAAACGFPGPGRHGKAKAVALG